MKMRKRDGWKLGLAAAIGVAGVLSGGSSVDVRAQQAQMPDAAPANGPTFTKDIAPILQRSCQNCHRPNGAAPMSLMTYEETRPWARSIKLRTGIGPKAGVMPPWYVERNVGIQHYKNDPSLSPAEIGKVAAWVDAGAPRGNPSDMPSARTFADDTVWSIGKPDLVVSTEEILVKGNAPDWWGEIANVATGLSEDRYVAAVEIKEMNDVPSDGGGRATVGGRYVFHHMIYRTESPELEEPADPATPGSAATATSWPVHEVGRNADLFDPDAAPLLRKGSYIVSDSVHLHSNGRDTKARLEIGFKLHPKGYTPKYKRAFVSLGNGLDIDIKPMEANQQLHAYAVLQQHTKIVTFEPHLHAPGARMCLEAIWGINIQTLTCTGYDHNWVRGYAYDEDHAPLLPKGTILHIIGYMDNSPNNKNVPDPRNWQGSGNRSVANMFIDLGMRVQLTDEQFEEEMNKRRARMRQTQSDVEVGCPLCNVQTVRPKPTTTNSQQQQRQQR